MPWKHLNPVKMNEIMSKKNNILNTYIELIDKMVSYPYDQKVKDTKTFIEEELLKEIKEFISVKPDDILSVFLTVDSQLNITKEPDVNKADLYIFQNQSSKYLSSEINLDNLPQTLTGKMYNGITVANKESEPISNLEIIKKTNNKETEINSELGNPDLFSSNEDNIEIEYKYRKDTLIDGKPLTGNMISGFPEFRSHHADENLNVLVLRISTAVKHNDETNPDVSEPRIKPLGVLTVISKFGQRLDLVRLRFLLQLRHALADFIQKIPKESFLHIRKSIDEEQFIQATKHREESLINDIVYLVNNCYEKKYFTGPSFCKNSDESIELIKTILSMQKSTINELSLLEDITCNELESHILYLLSTNGIGFVNPINNKKIILNINKTDSLTFKIPKIVRYSILVQIILNIRKYADLSNDNKVEVNISCKEDKGNRLLEIKFQNKINKILVQNRLKDPSRKDGFRLIKGQIKRFNNISNNIKLHFDHTKLKKSDLEEKDNYETSIKISQSL